MLSTVEEIKKLFLNLFKSDSKQFTAFQIFYLYKMFMYLCFGGICFSFNFNTKSNFKHVKNYEKKIGLRDQS